MKSSDPSETTSTCPVTGLPVFQDPSWRSVRFTVDHIVNIYLIGRIALLYQAHGGSSLASVRAFYSHYNAILDDHLPPGKRVTMLNDYAKFTRASPESREEFLRLMEKDSRLNGMIFYNTSLVMRLMINLGIMRSRGEYPVKVTTDYAEAISLAREWADSSPRPPESVPLPPDHTAVDPAENRAGARDTVPDKETSRCPVTGLPITYDLQFYNISVADNYAVSFMLVGSHILLTTPQGNPGKNGVAKVWELREHFLKKYGLWNSPFAEIRNYSHYGGWPSREARSQFAELLYEDVTRRSCVAYYGFNATRVIKWSFNVGCRIFRPNIDVRIVDNYAEAVQNAVRKLKEALPAGDSAAQPPPVPPADEQDHIQRLLRFLSHVNWEEEGPIIADTQEHNAGPFSPVYQSLALIKHDFDAVIREIKESEQKRRDLEEELRQSEKLNAIGQLAGGIAHDFNNHLTIIMNYASLIESDVPADSAVAAYAGKLMNASEQSANLTKQLLAYARKGQYVVTPLDMHHVIRSTIDLTERVLTKTVRLVADLRATRSCIKGDDSQLQNALLNLLLNARDAMGGMGTITITTENCTVDDHDGMSEDIEPPRKPADGYISISVSDTGTGVPDDIIGRIFEPFFTTKKLNEGNGMGLAAVYGTVTGHHGRITVFNNPDRGATFRVYLPVFSEQPDPEKPAAERDVHLGSVLVIDDEEYLCDSIQGILTKTGYAVTVFSDPEEAVEYYRRNHDDIDLVLLDMIMPKSSGKEVFAYLQRIRPDVKAVLMSGYSLEGAPRETLNAGARRFLQKPFRFEELVDVISRELAGDETG